MVSATRRLGACGCFACGCSILLVADTTIYQTIIEFSILLLLLCIFLFTGIVQVRINKWVLLSFCLPHKAHQIHNRGLIIEPETIDKCLQKLRPYHGILLMVCISSHLHYNFKMYSLDLNNNNNKCRCVLSVRNPPGYHRATCFYSRAPPLYSGLKCSEGQALSQKQEA